MNELKAGIQFEIIEVDREEYKYLLRATCLVEGSPAPEEPVQVVWERIPLNHSHGREMYTEGVGSSLEIECEFGVTYKIEMGVTDASGRKARNSRMVRHFLEWECVKGYEPVGGICVPACPPGYERVGVECLPICPIGYERDGTECVPACPPGHHRVKGVCEPRGEWDWGED